MNQSRPVGSHRAAVLGSPIGHSLSPALHRAAYTYLDLDWTFEAFEVDEAGLAAFVEACDDNWAGLALTMPLKRAALPLCASVSDLVVAVGAMNTLLWRPDGSRAGENTDVPGMVNALAERGIGDLSGADLLIVGGGATAASAVAAAAMAGSQSLDLVARNPQRAAGAVEVGARSAVSVNSVPWVDLRAAMARADVVFSTVPASAVADAVAGLGGVSPGVDRPVGVLFELIYDPWPTPLASVWTEAAMPVLSGLDLLVHQAALQVHLMTGRVVPIAVLRNAGESALALRSRL